MATEGNNERLWPPLTPSDFSEITRRFENAIRPYIRELVREEAAWLRVQMRDDFDHLMRAGVEARIAELVEKKVKITIQAEVETEGDK